MERMDSTEFNKIAGAGLAALLAFLLLNFFSGQIYGTGEVHSEEHVLAFALPVEETAGGEAEAPQVDLVALFSNPDLAVGEKDFRACTACHSLAPGENKVGPSLHGVVGRPVASVEGFSYSDAMAAHGGEWTPEQLFHFLGDPKGQVPGTKMSFAGIKDPQERADVIAYLNQQGDAPVDLTAGLPVPEANAAAAEGAAEGAAAAGAAEGSVTEGENTGGAVTGQTTVEPAKEGAAAPTPPAAGTAGEAPEGEGILHSSDPSPEAAVQQNPGTAGMPGEGSKPKEDQPEAASPDEAQAVPGQEAPASSVAGAEAPPQSPPGQAPAEGAAPGTGTDKQGAAEPAAPAEQMAAAPAGQTEAAAGSAGAGAAGGLDFASADAAAGEKLFRRCAACHKVEEGKNGIGPSLWGVVGRPVASLEGFDYSPAMQAHGGDWTPENLAAYLENPKAVVPGTKMAFAGLKDLQDRIDVIAYLNQHAANPQPLQ
jgi:cytochrome c2